MILGICIFSIIIYVFIYFLLYLILSNFEQHESFIFWFIFRVSCFVFSTLQLQLYMYFIKIDLVCLILMIVVRKIWRNCKDEYREVKSEVVQLLGHKDFRAYEIGYFMWSLVGILEAISYAVIDFVLID